MLFIPLIITIQLKKTDYNKKINEIQQNMPDHSKYSTTPEFKIQQQKVLQQDWQKRNQSLKVILLIL